MPRNPDGQKCVGTNGEDDPCGRWAIKGGTVCPTHGGSAPQVRAAADRTLAERELTKQVAKILPGMDATPVKDAEALLREVAGTQRALATAVATAMQATEDLGLQEAARQELRSLLRDVQACTVSLMQHGTPPDLDDDGIDGYTKLANLMDEMEAARDANMLVCPTCHGNAYIPRWTVVPEA